MTKSAKHVAVIMDGNGRWANTKKMQRYHGHAAGVKAVECAINSAVRNNIKYLTIFALSSENLGRPKAEIGFLTKIFYENISQRLEEFHSNNFKINFIGELSYFSDELKMKMLEATELTKNNTRLVITVALNYGGRWDIVQACNKLLQDKNRTGNVTEQEFSNQLSTGGLPDPDLLIRTSGVKRISNFLIWQFAYTELYFLEKYWPDFTEQDFDAALKYYESCERKFGLAQELVQD